MTRRPILLTPGPLTTALAVRRAMQRDWGSRNEDFITLTQKVRHQILSQGGALTSHVCIPLQGSGTYAVEAMLSSLLPDDSHSLILINGAYGHRMAEICRRLGRNFECLHALDDRAIDTLAVEARLDGLPRISHVLMVHCETTAGVLNPLEAIAHLCRTRHIDLLVDAMSSFGGIKIDLAALEIAALSGSSNKCLEGAPGVAFVLCRRDMIQQAQGRSGSLSLDLFDQWRGFETDGQWRFTPPVQVMAALSTALDLLTEEGGVTARQARYEQNCQILIAGMVRLGFDLYVEPSSQSPIIVTFRSLNHPDFHLELFVSAMHEDGFDIYPAKVAISGFRMGCIGAIDGLVMKRAVRVAGKVLRKMGIENGNVR